MNEPNAPAEILPLILILFPIAFGLFWSSVLILISRIGGWHRLVQTYPDQNAPETYSHMMSSGRMGCMNYNGVLKLHAGARRLHIAVILPFRPGHAPICLPWHALRVQEDSNLWIPLSRLEIQHQGRTIEKLQIRKATAEVLGLNERASG
ncbi:MAG: hypothetical protein RIF32_13595 [Leptospirales bacterium]